VVKRAVGALWARWQLLARRIADVQARLLLSTFYFVLLAPFALVARAVADPLRLSPRARRGWQPRAADPADPVTLARRQF
jgi:hypothetical protein